MTLEEYLNEHGEDLCTEPLPGYEDEWDELFGEEEEEDEDA